MATSRKALSVGEKLDNIASIKKGEKQASVCQRLSLIKTTVNTIWRNRESFKRRLESTSFSADCKRIHFSSQKDVDAALLQWFKQARSNNIPINGPLLLEKATSLTRSLGDESFVSTTGFIDRWKMRHGIVMRSVSGERLALCWRRTLDPGWMSHYQNWSHSTNQRISRILTRQGCFTSCNLTSH